MVGTVLDARATRINMITFLKNNVNTQPKVKHELLLDSHSLAYWCYCHLHGNEKQKQSHGSFTLMSVAFYALNIPYFIKITMLLLVKATSFDVLLRRKRTVVS